MALTVVSFVLPSLADGRDARYQPTPFPVVRAMLELADVRANDAVYDLGSGDGRIVIVAAKEFGARGVGVEIDPALVVEARTNARAAGVENKVTFIQGNMFTADISQATVVTLFLHPEPNLRLRPKLLAELPAGARIVSHVWSMGDWQPHDQRTVGERTVYLWKVPNRNSGARP